MRHQFRILVVDDHPDVLAMLQAMLTAEGFEVVATQDALSALRAAYQIHPDAILLDVMMPDVDGFEACRRLREMTDVPIIFVTAKGTIEDVVKGLSKGGRGIQPGLGVRPEADAPRPQPLKGGGGI